MLSHQIFPVFERILVEIADGAHFRDDLDYLLPRQPLLAKRDVLCNRGSLKMKKQHAQFSLCRLNLL